MTDWDQWLACTTCEAKRGEACESFSAHGPNAYKTPTRYLDAPHHRRKPAKGSGLEAAIPQPAPAPRTAAGTANPARRQAKRTAAKVTSWQQVADRQRARRT